MGDWPYVKSRSAIHNSAKRLGVLLALFNPFRQVAVNKRLLRFAQCVFNNDKAILFKLFNLPLTICVLTVIVLRQISAQFNPIGFMVRTYRITVNPDTFQTIR